MPEARSSSAGPRPPEREALIEKVVAVFDALMHRVASAHAPEFVGVGVTMSQAKVLYLVQARPGIRMSDLAARLGVTLPSISGVVERLVEHGCLARRDDPADRRQSLVSITERGAGQLELFRELNARHVRTLLGHIATADLVVVERALGILADAAEAAARPGSAPPPDLASSPSITTGGCPS
jgi:DNA-binding MarR family transcriptional regulator